MGDRHLLDEADHCRRQALAYVGRPEAQFLLSAASMFEELARKGALPSRDRNWEQ